MTMHQFLVPALLAALTLSCSLPATAARVCATYAEAKAHMGADGFILVAYADGWDAFSQQRCEQLMAERCILKAAGQAVLIPMPIPEQPDEARKKQQQELFAGLKLPGAHSYPALFFFNNKAEHYATLCGGCVSRGDAPELARLISARLAAGKERERLLAEAAGLQGSERAARLARAYQVEGLNWPGQWLARELTKLDPQDQSGAVRSWNFNGHGFAKRISALELGAGLAEVDKILADKAFTERQKQQACAAAIGLLRRKGGSSCGAQFKHYAGLMAKYGPETPEGQAAAYVLREWAPGLRYGKGWSSASLSLDTRPVEMEGVLPIREAGTYSVTFTYRSGPVGLSILAVELYDGKTKVAEDRHEGFAGHHSRDNVYTLKLRKPIKEPHLFITTNMDRRDSAGDITIIQETGNM